MRHDARRCSEPGAYTIVGLTGEIRGRLTDFRVITPGACLKFPEAPCGIWQMQYLEGTDCRAVDRSVAAERPPPSVLLEAFLQLEPAAMHRI